MGGRRRRLVHRRRDGVDASGGDPQHAPGGRSVPSVGGQVHDHLLDLARIGLDEERRIMQSRIELEILTVGPEIVNAVLQGFSDLATLQTTAAGTLPISDLKR